MSNSSHFDISPEDLFERAQKKIHLLSEIKPAFYNDRELGSRAKAYISSHEMGKGTGFEELDNVFRWVPGWFYLISGFPGSGKTQLMMQLLFWRAMKDRTMAAFISPEQENVDHCINLACCLAGGLRNVSNDHIDEVLKHVIFVGVEGLPKLSGAIDYFETLIELENAKYCLLDPMNAFVTDKKEFINFQAIVPGLTQLQQFAKQRNICLVVIEHPKTLSKGKDGGYPEYMAPMDINFGQMFWNKSSVFSILNRWPVSKHSKVTFQTWKVKNHSLGFKPGKVDLYYKVDWSRYYEGCEENEYAAIGGFSPWDKSSKKKGK